MTYIAIEQLIKKVVKDNRAKITDESSTRIIKDTLKLLVERLTTFALNTKDSMSLLHLYSSAQASLNTVMNRQDQQIKALIFDEDNNGVTTLNAQIQSDFVIYLLLNRIKLAYFPGKYTYDQLTQLRFQQTVMPSLNGKEIDFPEHAFIGEFK